MRLVRYQGGTSHQSDWPIGFSSHLSGKTTTLFWSVFPVGDLEGSSSWRRDGDRDQRKVMVLGWHQAKPPTLYARKSPTQTEAVLCLSMLNFYHRWFYWWKTAILQRLRNWLERRASCISVLDNHQKMTCQACVPQYIRHWILANNYVICRYLSTPHDAVLLFLPSRTKAFIIYLFDLTLESCLIVLIMFTPEWRSFIKLLVSALKSTRFTSCAHDQSFHAAWDICW